MTPSPRALQSAIVHPLRSDGANAVEGRLRLSHLTVNGSLPLAAFDEAVCFLLAGAGVDAADGSSALIMVILKEVTESVSIHRVASLGTDRKNQVSSNMTPTGRLPLAYSKQ